MIKQDYNSNFKMKISRSLTDLQNSLDEACRLGLPPHFETVMATNYDGFSRNYNVKNNVTQNLQRIISNKERSIQDSQFIPPTNSALINQNNEHGSNNSVIPANHRERYLNVLRSLADENRNDKLVRESGFQLQRSHSYDALNEPPPRLIENVNRGNTSEELTREVRMLRQRLVQMDEEMMRMRSEECTRCRDDFSGEQLCDDLRKKVETYRGREEALLRQLNDAVTTIEEAKFEEMQAVMQADKAKEDLIQMERRFQEYLEDNVKKMESQTESIEREVQLSIRRVVNELEETKAEVREKYGECQNLREQLKNSQGEVDRVNMSLKSIQIDRSNVEHNLESAVARAMMQRDETVAQNTRLHAALEKERVERGSERSILQEEIADLRKRLAVAENNEVNGTQEKIVLIKECEEVKNEMGKMKQAVLIERRREQEELEGREREWNNRVGKLSQELSIKQSYFESVIADAEQVMQTQGKMIERLKVELSMTVKEMERWADNGREEREELQWRLARTNDEVAEHHGKVRELQDVVDKQEQLLESMRGKYQDIEETKKRQDAEILGLMASRNGLMRSLELMQGHLTEFRRRVGDCECGVFDAGEQLINAKLLEDVVAAM